MWLRPLADVLYVMPPLAITLNELDLVMNTLAAAILASGVAQPDTTVPCPGSVTIDGRAIPNENNFDLGTITLTQAQHAIVTDWSTALQTLGIK